MTIGYGDLEKGGNQKCVSLNIRKKMTVLFMTDETFAQDCRSKP